MTDRIQELRRQMAQPPRRLVRLFGPKEDVPPQVIHLGQLYLFEKGWTSKAPNCKGRGFLEAVFVRTD